jgi:hypothetical protein
MILCGIAQIRPGSQSMGITCRIQVNLVYVLCIWYVCVCVFCVYTRECLCTYVSAYINTNKSVCSHENVGSYINLEWYADAQVCTQTFEGTLVQRVHTRE